MSRFRNSCKVCKHSLVRDCYSTISCISHVEDLFKQRGIYPSTKGPTRACPNNLVTSYYDHSPPTLFVLLISNFPGPPSTFQWQLPCMHKHASTVLYLLEILTKKESYRKGTCTEDNTKFVSRHSPFMQCYKSLAYNTNGTNLFTHS